MSDEPEVYDADYVAKLRNEAGKYRTKVKDLESELNQKKDLEGQILQVRVENELVRRGVTAEPSWIQIEDPSDIAAAVDKFVEKYPQFSAASQEEEPAPQRRHPAPMPSEPSKANTPGPPPKGYYGGRSIDEIKEDPKARTLLTDEYRRLAGTTE